MIRYVLFHLLTSLAGEKVCSAWFWSHFFALSKSACGGLVRRVRHFVQPWVLDGFFLYLAQMITIIRGCVACSPRNEVRGGILDSPCLSVCPSVCPLTFRVRPVASTVHDGFFPYLVQMINSMRGCVACDDLWPWPISSRSFGLDLENRVRSVASTVLDGFFLYLAQMITIIRGCVACYFFFQNLEIWLFGEFLKFFGLDLEKKIYSSWRILPIFSTNEH